MLVALQLDITSQCALCGQLTGVASNVGLQLDITSQCALCGQLTGVASNVGCFAVGHHQSVCAVWPVDRSGI